MIGPHNIDAGLGRIVWHHSAQDKKHQQSAVHAHRYHSRSFNMALKNIGGHHQPVLFHRRILKSWFIIIIAASINLNKTSPMS